MKNRFVGPLFIVIMLAFAAVAFGQLPQPAGPTKAVPRTPSGKPDLSGTWKTVNVRAEPVQLTSWGRERYAYNKLPNSDAVHPEFDPIMHCYRPGLARLGPPLQVPSKSIRVRIDGESVPFPDGPSGFDAIHIAYARNKVWVLYQYNHEIRQIFTDGRKHPEQFDDVEDDPDSTWFNGYSTGTWDGDTFVVDTTNLRNAAWLDNLGHEFRKLRITERYRRVDEDTLEIERTLSDPIAFTKPYVTRATLKLTPSLTFQPNEICDQYYVRKTGFGFGGLMGINAHPWQLPEENPNPTWQDVERNNPQSKPENQ